MNPWRRGPLAKNPYARNAFRVARVPREIVRRRTIVQLMGQTKRVVSADPRLHTIKGEPVTEAEINAAEQILLDPKQRIVEELLVHATERPKLERVHKLAQQIAEAMKADENAPLQATNLKGLQPWVREIVKQFLDAKPGEEPSLDTLEAKFIPPFGQPEED